MGTSCLQFQHRDPLCGRKIPLEMQDSPLHKPHLWLENSRAWLCSYLHFWAARGTSPKSLESSLKTIRRMPARFLLYYFCSCYKSRKQSLKNPTKATSKAGKHHLSFPTLDISICKYKSGTAVEKVTLYTESKHMTCTWIVTIKEEGISSFISVWIPAKSLLVPGYATDGSNVMPGWQVPKGEHALAGGAVHS